MSEETNSFKRLVYSISFRLQVLTILLSLVGIYFGVRDYQHITEQLSDDKSAPFFNDLMLQVAIAVAFNLIAAYVIYVITTRPIHALSETINAFVNGRLDIEFPNVNQNTEIGSMADKISQLIKRTEDKLAHEQQQQQMALKKEAEKRTSLEQSVKQFEASILSDVEIVSTTAGDMRYNAQNLSDMADKTSKQSSSVASATEQTSANVQTVASSVEELSASISEINTRVTESERITSQAVEEVRRADTTISTLSEAAVQIGDVVKLIQDIAAQTNLLALNATIEAARAGEAGKGFAVVANEVKNLATQTASATEDISKKIATVQNVSKDSVDAIQGIGMIIEQTSEITRTIANAIQQQDLAVKEISNSAQQASMGIGQITNSISGVTKDANESQEASREVLSDSNKLMEQADRLQKQIKAFLNKIN